MHKIGGHIYMAKSNSQFNEIKVVIMPTDRLKLLGKKNTFHSHFVIEIGIQTQSQRSGHTLSTKGRSLT